MKGAMGKGVTSGSYIRRIIEQSLLPLYPKSYDKDDNLKYSRHFQESSFLSLVLQNEHIQ